LRKAKKKEWKLPTLKDKSKIKEGERLSSLEREKEVSIKKRHNIRQKLIPKKPEKILSYKHCLLVSMVKPLMIRLDIHQGRSWICFMTYVKRILIFEVNKVICHFLYKDNKRKRIDE
jgi:hypothetical protein